MNLMQDKVVWVTGGASGIGQSTCKAMAEHGAKVIVTDIQDEMGEQVAKDIKASGSEAIYLHQDTTEEARWSEIAAEIQNRFGGLHCLVNNAGIGNSKSILETTLEDWRHMFAINIDAIFLGTKATLEMIHASGGGTIVNISSVAGLRGAAGLSTYCATKGAVRLYTKSVALEAASNGLQVRCNSVHPGLIHTPIWDSIINDETPDSEQSLMDFATQQAEALGVDVSNLSRPELVSLIRVPGGRVGQPEEVAKGVVFLASDLSSYVNGSELVIDSALTAGV